MVVVSDDASRAVCEDYAMAVIDFMVDWLKYVITCLNLVYQLVYSTVICFHYESKVTVGHLTHF